MTSSPSRPVESSHSKNRKAQKRVHPRKIINLILNLFGKKTKKTFSSVISHLTEAYEKEGLISAEEKKMFKNITSFGDKKVSSIATPRSDIIAISQDASLEEIKKIITTDGHTRIPVFAENFDEVTGFIHSKDLARFLCDGDEDFSVKKILRKILFVPGSMKLLDVMLRMRTARVHIAIILDEFGGVDGLVTIENLMEEIVGDIEDEHDFPTESSFFRIKKIDDGTFQFGGRVEIKKLEEILHKRINQNEGFQTVSGLAMSAFSRVPEIDEEIEKYGLKIKILDADNRVVKLAEITTITED